MSDAKHTPGTWEACDVGDYGDYDGECRVILGDDLRIAVVLGDHDESKANASLIAAAPDLFAALEELATCVEDGCYCSEMRMAAAVDEARAAIAKARGQ